MRFMNRFDVEEAVARFSWGTAPNRYYVARVVQNLVDWTDRNSDGWPYWPKPARAAAKAFALIDGYTWSERREQEMHDATEAEVKAALAPIKAFLTRQGVPHEEVFG